ncbi:MAG: lipocalin family protein [Bacteroidales bacterium]|nr:lipocalin family protein [Bacteroidales bacterium]
MKKWFRNLLLIALGLVTVGSFSACDDDDDDDYSNYKSLIIGSWKSVYVDGYSIIVTFYEDGTGIDYDYDDEFGEIGESTEDFTWSLSGNKLLITAGDSEIPATIKKLTKTELTLTILGETTTAYRVEQQRK